MIEVERHRKTNPPIPDWLARSDQQAWENLLKLADDDLGQIKEALAVLAIGAGQIQTGALLLHLDPSDINELAEERLAWSDLYKQ